MDILFIWLALSVIAGIIAGNKGRSGFGFFLLSVVLSPLVGIIGALIAKPNRSKMERDQIKSGGMKRCPYCAELVKKAALVCKHCGKDIPKSDATETQKKLSAEKAQHYEAQFGEKPK